MCESLRIQLSLQPPQLSTRLSHLYLKQELTDLTIRCPNGSLMAHKLVLSVVSNFFRQQFTKNNKSGHCLIIFCDISIEDIKTIVDIIYLGRQLITSDRSQHLLKIAERLQINLISTEKNANKSRKNINKEVSIDSVNTLPKAMHQNSLQTNYCQLLSDGNEIQNGLIISEAENDISFVERHFERPLDLRTDGKGDKPLATNSTIATNSKRRQRKQSDPKQNRKFIKFDESIFDTICGNSTEDPVAQTNESTKTVLNEITGSSSNIPNSQNSLDQLSTLPRNHLSANEALVKTLDFEERADLSQVKSENTCCLKTCDQISVESVKKEPSEEITECCVCEQCFSNEKQLLNHLRRKHKNEKEAYQCNFCKDIFRGAKKFAQHSILCKIKFN